MRNILTISLLLLCLTVTSQVITKDMVKPVIIRSGLMLLSGFADGTSEVLKVKYQAFDNVFPGANAQYWDYNQSWTNKYKDGVPPDAKFPFSKTALVWTTDGYHMARMVRNCTMVAALTIPIGKHKERKWYSYVAESAVYYVSYTAGFNLAYDVVFK